MLTDCLECIRGLRGSDSCSSMKPVTRAQCTTFLKHCIATRQQMDSPEKLYDDEDYDCADS